MQVYSDYRLSVDRVNFSCLLVQSCYIFVKVSDVVEVAVAVG